MHLRNLTPFPVHLFRGALDDVDMFAVLALRATCLVSDDGRLVPEQTQAPVREHPEDTPEGPLEEDAAPLKPGIDVVVLGSALSARPVTEMAVHLRVGKVVRSLHVFGDRRWLPRRGLDLAAASARSRKDKHDLEALVPSAPARFTEMPLGAARALGGVTETPAGEIPYLDNPEGIGFYYFLDRAANAPLPNLEEPDRPIAHFRDWAPPAGLGPLRRNSKLRIERGHKIVEKNQLEILPAYYSMAPAAQLFERIDPGTVIAVDGMHVDGTVRFRMPELAPRAEVSVGGDRMVLPFELDTVEIWPKLRRVGLVARTSFRYPVNAGEERGCVVEMAHPPRF